MVVLMGEVTEPEEYLTANGEADDGRGLRLTEDCEVVELPLGLAVSREDFLEAKAVDMS